MYRHLIPEGISLNAKIRNRDQFDEQDDEEEISNAAIVGVPKLDCFKCCLQCKARVEPSDYITGRCSKQRLHDVAVI